MSDIQLTGNQLKQFQQALINAYPTHDTLQQMLLYEVETSLDIVASGENHQIVVTNLLRWADSRGKLRQLLEAAHRDNPDNDKLSSFYTNLHQSASRAPVAHEQNLTPLVVPAVTNLTKLMATFTAYDVTIMLREFFPDRFIPHTHGVRQEVHQQMEKYIQAGTYTMRLVSYGGQSARQYVPVQ